MVIKLKLETLVVGQLQANCYVITKNDKSIIIDPGDEAEKIINFCKDKNVVGVLITHSHFDHVGALKEIEDNFNIRVNNVKEDFGYEVIKTPGHTSDSVTYYFPLEKIMITGDFLFEGSIGRMDLPTGSVSDMQKSLDIISKYDNEIKIYPGHGNASVLGREKQYFNYYI